MRGYAGGACVQHLSQRGALNVQIRIVVSPSYGVSVSGQLLCEYLLETCGHCCK